MIPNGIFFYGAGGLYSYYLGIAMYLQENYDLKNVSFGGLSGGSIAAVALSAELMTKNSFDDFIRPCLKSIRDSNINNSIFGELFSNSLFGPNGLNGLKPKLGSIIEESGKFPEINKKTSILVTKVKGIYSEGDYISHWDSVSDLMECVVTSCWIPFVFGNATHTFRDKECVDGGMSFILPDNRNYPDEEHNWIPISLNTFRNFSNNGIGFVLHSSLLSLSLCADDEYVKYLIDMGYEDAKNNKDYFNKLTLLKKN
jgi:hypothetical protein|tara:strand:- start:90 stop:857 length:768 start_codon:yes stop_codon:yes gene_type:complete